MIWPLNDTVRCFKPYNTPLGTDSEQIGKKMNERMWESRKRKWCNTYLQLLVNTINFIAQPVYFCLHSPKTEERFRRFLYFKNNFIRSIRNRQSILMHHKKLTSTWSLSKSSWRLLNAVFTIPFFLGFTKLAGFYKSLQVIFRDAEGLRMGGRFHRVPRENRDRHQG